MNGAILNQSVKGSASNISASYPVASGNTVSAGDVVDVVNGEVVPHKVLSSLPEGSIVTLTENGRPTEFYVAKHNYESNLNGEGRTLIVRKDCYNKQEWNNSNLNYYSASAIHIWLNNIYKNLLNKDVQEQIGTTKIIYTPGNGNWSTNTLSASIFLLSATELGQTASWFNKEGTMLPNVSNYKISQLEGIAVNQWTRSPNIDNSLRSVYLNTNGTVWHEECIIKHGCRPAFTLPNTFSFSSENTFSPKAIALSNANAGQTVEVAYSGTFEVPWVKQGTQIASDGVNGFAPLDRVLSVTPYWDKGAKIEYGSYKGTGVLPVSVTLSFKPLFIILGPVGWDLLEQNLGSTSYAWPCIIPYGVPSARFGNDIANFSWEGTTFRITKLDRLNETGKTYHYFAFG